ncbi:hypothetical protein C9J21_17430 [Photobacterium phosphoreum]|uniref:Uncharacterized protein n=1 Tax=Photobacterium phosphoreum TaxID=659 RepID=A0A2T3JQL6_PHOPO|nr:hypothetical protein [Photobacterium phosphoreum]PQJ92417.1 hypothetical protein BTO21_03900 [Photobacterium phosphoreum]PSU27830.1 hypothetical protein CTM96_00585 [Photobacterium phosphoreum]PSU38435.1 hypothetical protein CTM97_19020 [Photobacterium phosphoreum]PSU41103.1 hypothetical protein CTM85_00355 [Photobacterium phosphoreum]
MSLNSGATHQVAHVELIKLLEKLLWKKHFYLDAAIQSNMLRQKQGDTIQTVTIYCKESP